MRKRFLVAFSLLFAGGAGPAAVLTFRHHNRRSGLPVGRMVSQCVVASPAIKIPDFFTGPEPIQVRLPKLMGFEAWVALYQTSKIQLNSDADLQHLRSNIDRSDLSAMEMFRLAKLVGDRGDKASALVFSHAGLFKCEGETAGLSTGALSEQELTQLSFALQACSKQLWEEYDPTTLKELIALEDRLPRADEWDETSQWNQINFVHVLLNKQQYDVALAQIKQIRGQSAPGVSYNAEQLRELEWEEGLALFHCGEGAKAEPLLKHVVKDGGDHAVDAQNLLSQISEPTTPLAILTTHYPRHMELESWAKRWDSSTFDARPNSPMELAHLADLISKSDLSARERLGIGRIIEKRGDVATAAHWYRSGVNETQIELAAAQHGGSDPIISKKTLAPLLLGLDKAQGLFWLVSDGQAEREIADLNLSLLRVNNWDQRPEWARIAHGEALLLLGCFAEALTEANSIEADASLSNSHFTDEQKTELHWLKGVTLFSMHRYEESAGHLVRVADCYNFHHAKDAWPLLIEVLLRATHVDDADRRYQDYLVLYKPDFSTSIQLAALIEEARSSQ